MALTALALCSRALLRIGVPPLTSFDDGTAEAEVAAGLYPGARDALLSAHPWSFATGQQACRGCSPRRMPTTATPSSCRPTCCGRSRPAAAQDAASPTGSTRTGCTRMRTP
jgi:hypothetical protein